MPNPKKAVLVGDLFIPATMMREEFSPLAEMGYEIEALDFSVGDYDELQQFNLAVEKEGPGTKPLPEDLVALLQQADLIVVHFCPISGELLARCPHLKLIGTCRTGTSNIETEEAKSKGVTVINCRGRLANAVADFTLGLLLAETRNIARGHLAMRQGNWRRSFANTGHIPELPGRTVGLVGFGAIGQAVARRLRGFDVRILACDPYLDRQAAESLGVEICGLDELLGQSDFVSLHCNVTQETRHLLNAESLARMKPSAYLINTSRSSLVDEEALVVALREKQIAGAALDVFDQEPLPCDHPLMTLDNVTLTPHMAGGSDDAFRRSVQMLRDLILEHLSGAVS